MLGAFAVACILGGAFAPAAAAGKSKRMLRFEREESERASKEPFGNIPKGPLQIIISTEQQRLHLYSDGTEVADTAVATGVPAHPTPLGIFSIIEKNRYHRSNIYSGAPMPYMERITWSGVALHEGGNLGHPASHGCIRMSHDFAVRLWALTRLGVRVIIARPDLRPQDFADSRLFVHREYKEEKPASPVPTASTPASPVTAKIIEAAQTTADGSAADVPHEDGKSAAIAPVRQGIAAAATAAADAPTLAAAGGTGAAADAEAALVDAPDTLPLPPPRPAEIAHVVRAPITIFISRKEKKLYVRQKFSPLFSAPITIEHPDEPIGTHVFTALDYLSDHSSFRWNVVSVPDRPRVKRRPEHEKRLGKYSRTERRIESAAEPASDPLPTAQQALARIDIPQDVIDQISRLIVPGSSLIISDQGLGDETGEGTGFIVVTHDSERAEAGEERRSPAARRRARHSGGFYLPPMRYWEMLDPYRQ